jgi:hypothetical protein
VSSTTLHIGGSGWHREPAGVRTWLPVDERVNWPPHRGLMVIDQSPVAFT